MKYKPTELKEVVEIIPEKFYDERGWFAEMFNMKEMSNLTMFPKTDFSVWQQNISYSRKGVFRGFHYQKEFPQIKIVSCLKGRVLDFAVDVRKYSETYLKHVMIKLSPDESNMLYIPEGFAHGFISLSESIVSYIVDGEYKPNDEAGLRYDNIIGINWPDIIRKFDIDKLTISEKDMKW